jgi:hypothetical protein
MRSNVSSKSLIVFALSLMLAVWALPTVNATAETVILGGGAVAFEIVGEVNNSAPGVVPATSEIFGYLCKVDGIDQVFTDSDPTHQNESTALITFDTDATTIRVTPHGPFRIIDRDGTTTMYLNNGPSTFSDPSTFRQGTPFQVSSFHQQVIVDTVESTFTVVNTNTVTSSSKFAIGGINYLLFKPGQNLRTTLQGVLSTRNAGSPPPTGFFSGYAVEAGD